MKTTAPAAGRRSICPDSRPALSGLDQIPGGLDAPAAGKCRQLRGQAPAVGQRSALVIRSGALQGHGSRVVANRPQLRNLVLTEDAFGYGGQLGALGLDRLGVGT